MNRKTVIACKIFEHELTAVLASKPDTTVRWIDAALHADSDRMKVELDTAISTAIHENKGTLCFLFGNGCHPDMGKIVEGCGARLPLAKNCIQAMVGPERTKALEANRTMVITPGWLTAWPEIMAGLGWDTVDVRMNLGRYNRILLLDTGIVPIDDEQILAFYDLVQVPVEIEPIDLDHFKQWVAQTLA